MTIDPACPEVGGGPPGAGEFGPVRGFSTQNPQPLTESSKVKAPQRIRQALSAASLAGSGRRLQRGGCSGILKFARGEAWGIRHTSWSLDGSRRNQDACSAHVFSGGRIRLRSGSRLRSGQGRGFFHECTVTARGAAVHVPQPAASRVQVRACPSRSRTAALPVAQTSRRR